MTEQKVDGDRDAGTSIARRWLKEGLEAHRQFAKGLRVNWVGMNWRQRLLFVLGVISPTAFLAWLVLYLPQHNFNLFASLLFGLIIVGTAVLVAAVAYLLGGFDQFKRRPSNQHNREEC